MGLQGPDYAGPAAARLNPSLVNTKAEVEGGQVKGPDGTKPVVVEPGDNLSTIAERNHTTVDQLLKDNPQWSLNPAQEPGKRDANLIYPGEVVFVRPGGEGGRQPTAASKATDQAAQQLVTDQKRHASNDAQITGKENAVASDKAAVEQAVRNELAGGGDAAAIKARLQAQGVDQATANQIVDAAGTPASATNPVGGAAAKDAPFLPANDTNKAAAAAKQPSSSDSQISGKENDFKAAVKTELDQGVPAQQIKARYGNDSHLNGLIDQANAQHNAEQTTDKSAQSLAQAQAGKPSTDSQATGKDNAVAQSKAAVEQSVRNELVAGGDADKIKSRLMTGGLDNATATQIVDAAGKPASATNPVGGAAAKDAPFLPANDTNKAAVAIKEPSSSDSQITGKDDAFKSAVATELQQGITVQELKDRYGNDPHLNSLIDQAAKS